MKDRTAGATSPVLRGIREEYGWGADEIQELNGINPWPNQPSARQVVCWVGRMPHMELNDCALTESFVFHVDRQNMDELVRSRRWDDESNKDGAEVGNLRIVSIAQLAAEIKATPGKFSPGLLALWYDCPSCWPKGTPRNLWPIPHRHATP
jgi:hypothetical protein